MAGKRITVRRAAPLTVLCLVAACHGSGKPASVTATTTVPTANASVTTAPGTGGGGSSTTIVVQTSGPRTVLSPIGLNVRAQASKTAAVVGTAAQGALLTVLGHTGVGGSGWYQVKGATVTGFITDNPVLSADGKFKPYTSTPLNFSALYPENWTPTEVPPASVVFRSGPGGDSIVVSTATTAKALGRGRSGYRQDNSAVAVVCGVTGDLVIYSQAGSQPGSQPGSQAGGATTATTSQATATGSPGATVAERYLVQVHLTLDGQHALGVDANLADLAQLQMIKDVVNSISFPFPQCEQGAAPSDTSSTAPTATVH